MLKEKTYEKELFGGIWRWNVSLELLKTNKGTLLIDEVSEIPIETQANVLEY